MPYIKNQIEKNIRTRQSFLIKLLTIEGRLPVSRNITKEVIKK